MRFMMFLMPRGYESATPGSVPDARAVELMMQYNRQLKEAGVLLSLEGLHPASMGARVRFSAGGRPVVSKGPFAGAKESIGGYWIIEVASRDEAVEWAKRCPVQDAIIEVRQVQELADFPAGIREAMAGIEELQHH